METLRQIVLFVHLIGFATLFGSWAVQAFGGKHDITRLMHIGVTIAAVAGFALAAPWGVPEGVEFNYAKIGTKLVVVLIIGAFLGIGQASGSACAVLGHRASDARQRGHCRPLALSSAPPATKIDPSP